jgi:succinate-acetate transporter protein
LIEKKSWRAANGKPIGLCSFSLSSLFMHFHDFFSIKSPDCLYEAKGTLMIVFLQLLVKNLGATKEAVSSINIIYKNHRAANGKPIGLCSFSLSSLFMHFHDFFSIKSPDFLG